MPTPPGFASCSYELKHALSSRSAFVTFGCDVTGTDPVAIAVGVAGAFAAPGSLFATLDSQLQLQNTRVALGTDGGEDIVGSSPTLVGCTLPMTSLPSNCAALVHKVTARGGRRGRGRMYLPWALATGDVGETGVILTGRVTALQTAVTAWLAAMAAGPGPVVLLHRTSGPEVSPPTTPGVPNTVTSVRVDPLVATQRRRLGR